MSSYLNSSFDLDADNIIEVLDETPFWSAPFGLKLLEHIQLKKNMTALDIGFGAGFPLTEIAMRLGSSSKIYGLDPWESAARRAKKKLDVYGIRNVEILKGVAENIPLADGAIDMITSNNGINNVQDLQKTILECNRVLKQGGQFIQTVNLNTTMIEFYDTLEATLQEQNMSSEISKMKEHIHDKRKPLHEFLGLLENNNFEIRNVIHDKFTYHFVDGTTMLNHYFIRLAFLDSWKQIIPEHQQRNIFQIVEEKLNKQAEKKGKLILSVPFVLIDCMKN